MASLNSAISKSPTSCFIGRRLDKLKCLQHLRKLTPYVAVNCRSQCMNVQCRWAHALKHDNCNPIDIPRVLEDKCLYRPTLHPDLSNNFFGNTPLLTIPSSIVGAGGIWQIIDPRLTFWPRP